MPEETDEFDVVRVFYAIPLLPYYPAGFEAELRVPRSKIEAAKIPPFWRGGETMTIRRAA